MENVDYIVVGDGYAALFFAHRLLRENKRFVLFSEGKKSASQVSAGIVNPVVLKKFTTFWKAQEQINELKETLEEITVYTGKNYLIEENIRRLFHDEKEKALWLKKSDSEELEGFLSKTFTTLEGVKNPYGSGQVMQSARLDVSAFFSDMLGYLDRNGYLLTQRFDYELLNASEKTYKNYRYGRLIFAEGMGVRSNPYFAAIPVHPNKGHHLVVSFSEGLEQGYTLKKKHFLFPLGGGHYYYGGTYDREQKHHEIDASAVDQLTRGLEEFYEKSYRVEHKNFGFRPTVKDRRPIIGAHKDFSDLYVFNGLGARGILNGCYFSRILFNHLESGAELPAEVRLDRFREEV